MSSVAPVRLERGRTVRLADVARTASGTTPSRSRVDFWESPKYPWVKTGEVAFSPIWVTEEAVSEAAIAECSLTVLPPGTVLVAMYGQGKTRGQSAVLEVFATTNQACFAILPNETFHPEYLQYWLRHSYQALRRLSDDRGGNQSNLNGEILNGLEIPWVDRTSQVNVATQLKSQLVAVDEVRTAARALCGETDALLAAVYREAFVGVVPVAVPPDFEAAPTGWRWTKLGDVARLESGHTPSRSRPDWWGGDISWVSLTEIRALDGRWVEETQIKTNPAGIANSAARVLPRGTVCFSRTASVGFVTIMAKPMATSQDFANWVCGDDLDPEFLMHALIRSRAELRALATGATHKTIYMPTLQAFHVCLPDRATQQRIVARLKNQLAAAEAVRQSAKAQLSEIERLPQRLLAQAFAPTEDQGHG